MAGNKGISPVDEALPSLVQRPDLSPSDPQGGFNSNPDFSIIGSIDNGGEWNSRTGNTRNRFVAECD